MAATWTDHHGTHETVARSFEPAARLYTKDGWIWRPIAAVVWALRFGRRPYRDFLDNYATTFGPIQAYPRSFKRLSDRLLRHECRHTTQSVALGWFVPVAGWFFGRRVRAWAGLLPMAVLYGLVFFPFGLAYGRYWLERDADRAMYRWALSKGYSAQWVRDRAQEFAGDVCGAAYAWSWPSGWGIRGFLRVANDEIKAA